MSVTGKGDALAADDFDGWGVGDPGNCNAISCAKTPNFQRLLDEYPHTVLQTSGEVVGLPAGQMGNSEVGHLNIGAGRIVYQDLTRIDLAVRKGELGSNPVLAEAMQHAIKNNAALHLMGLLSDGGVHSDIEHLFGLLQMAADFGLKRVFVQAF